MHKFVICVDLWQLEPTTFGSDLWWKDLSKDSTSNKDDIIFANIHIRVISRQEIWGFDTISELFQQQPWQFVQLMI